jgi:hypothetical protein
MEHLNKAIVTSQRAPDNEHAFCFAWREVRCRKTRMSHEWRRHQKRDLYPNSRDLFQKGWIHSPFSGIRFLGRISRHKESNFLTGRSFKPNAEIVRGNGQLNFSWQRQGRKYLPRAYLGALNLPVPASSSGSRFEYCQGPRTLYLACHQLESYCRIIQIG